MFILFETMEFSHSDAVHCSEKLAALLHTARVSVRFKIEYIYLSVYLYSTFSCSQKFSLQSDHPFLAAT